MALMVWPAFILITMRLDGQQARVRARCEEQLFSSGRPSAKCLAGCSEKLLEASASRVLEACVERCAYAAVSRPSQASYDEVFEALPVLRRRSVVCSCSGNGTDITGEPKGSSHRPCGACAACADGCWESTGLAGLEASAAACIAGHRCAATEAQESAAMELCARGDAALPALVAACGLLLSPLCCCAGNLAFAAYAEALACGGCVARRLGHAVCALALLATLGGGLWAASSAVAALAQHGGGGDSYLADGAVFDAYIGGVYPTLLAACGGVLLSRCCLSKAQQCAEATEEVERFEGRVLGRQLLAQHV